MFLTQYESKMALVLRSHYKNNLPLESTPMNAQFKKMSESTKEDWELIREQQAEFGAKLPDRILDHMMLLSGDYGGFPIDRLQHSLQTAELAQKDGRDEEYIICALLHDIGDSLGTTNHPDVAAAILEPFISEANYWMIKHHGIFQGVNFFHHIGLDRNMRDQFKDHEHYARTEEFINKYDDPAFDSSLPKLELSKFEPMLRRVFAAPKKSIYRK